MDSARLLECLASDSARLRAVATRDLNAPVPTCPGWTVEDLVRHVAHGYLNVVVPRLLPPEHAPTHDLSALEPLAALELGYTAMTSAFAAHAAHDDPRPATPDTARFWIRRMAHETVIHRVDAELALHETPAPIPPDQALDGVEEFLTVFLAQETQQWTDQYAADLSDWAQRWLLLSAGDAHWRIVVRANGVYATPLDPPSAPHDTPAASIRAEPDVLLRWFYNRADPNLVTTTGDQRMAAQLRRLLTAVTSTG